MAVLTPVRMDLMPKAKTRPRVPTAPAAQPDDTTGIVQGLRRIVRALHTYSQDVRTTYGLTGPQLWALKTLRGRGRMAMGQLAAALVVDQSSISLLVARLERRGLVRRIRRRADRRFVELELTQRGDALAAEAPAPAQGRLLHALQRMPAQDVRRIRRSVERLVEAMEATDVQARFFFSDD